MGFNWSVVRTVVMGINQWVARCQFLVFKARPGPRYTIGFHNICGSLGLPRDSTHTLARKTTKGFRAILARKSLKGFDPRYGSLSSSRVSSAYRRTSTLVFVSRQVSRLFWFSRESWHALQFSGFKKFMACRPTKVVIGNLARHPYRMSLFSRPA
jgi:hypothetical protein